jgi:hypothetical protein
MFLTRNIATFFTLRRKILRKFMFLKSSFEKKGTGINGILKIFKKFNNRGKYLVSLMMLHWRGSVTASSFREAAAVSHHRIIPGVKLINFEKIHKMKQITNICDELQPK